MATGRRNVGTSLGCAGFTLLTLAVLGALVTVLVLVFGTGPPTTRFASGIPSASHRRAARHRDTAVTVPTTAARTPTTPPATTAPRAYTPFTTPVTSPASPPTTVTPGAASTIPSPAGGAPVTAGTSCTLTEVGHTVRGSTGALLLCVRAGPTAQWVVITG